MHIKLIWKHCAWKIKQVWKRQVISNAKKCWNLFMSLTFKSMDKLDMFETQDGSSSMTDSNISLPIMERTGSVRKKRRSTIITVQMLSKKGQLGGQKINTVQVAAESKVKQLEVSRKDDSSLSTSRSTISDTTEPLTVKKISSSDSDLKSRKGRPRSTSYERGQFHGITPPSDPSLDTLQRDSLDLDNVGSTKPRHTSTPDSGFKTLPQYSPILTSSDNSFSSASSSTQGLVTSASDNSIPIRYLHKVPSYDAVMLRKSYDTVIGKRQDFDGIVTCVSMENLHVHNNPGITTSASDSNINVSYQKRGRPHSFHQGSYDVIEESENASASDSLFQRMHSKRTASESEFTPRCFHKDPISERDTWTSCPLLHGKVKKSYI